MADSAGPQPEIQADDPPVPQPQGEGGNPPPAPQQAQGEGGNPPPVPQVPQPQGVVSLEVVAELQAQWRAEMQASISAAVTAAIAATQQANQSQNAVVPPAPQPPEGAERQPWWPSEGYTGAASMSLHKMKEYPSKYSSDGGAEKKGMTADRWLFLFSDHLQSCELPVAYWGSYLWQSVDATAQQYFANRLPDQKPSEAGYYVLGNLLLTGPFRGATTQFLLRVEMQKMYVSGEWARWTNYFQTHRSKCKDMSDMDAIGYFLMALPVQFRDKLLSDDKGVEYTQFADVFNKANSILATQTNKNLLDWGHADNQGDFKAVYAKEKLGLRNKPKDASGAGPSKPNKPQAGGKPHGKPQGGKPQGKPSGDGKGAELTCKACGQKGHGGPSNPKCPKHDPDFKKKKTDGQGGKFIAAIHTSRPMLVTDSLPTRREEEEDQRVNGTSAQLACDVTPDARANTVQSPVQSPRVTSESVEDPVASGTEPVVTNNGDAPSTSDAVPRFNFLRAATLMDIEKQYGLKCDVQAYMSSTAGIQLLPTAFQEREYLDADLNGTMSLIHAPFPLTVSHTAQEHVCTTIWCYS